MKDRLSLVYSHVWGSALLTRFLRSTATMKYNYSVLKSPIRSKNARARRYEINFDITYDVNAKTKYKHLNLNLNSLIKSVGAYVGMQTAANKHKLSQEQLYLLTAVVI